MKFLNETGAGHLVDKIKALFVAKESGKGLSKNDFTDTLKTKLEGVADSAQVNVLEGVKVKDASGTSELSITDKKVTVDLSDYAKKSEIGTVYKPKGSCTWATLIAKTDAQLGDVWNVTDKSGVNYACIVATTAGEDSWDALGGTVDLSNYYTKSETNNELDKKVDLSVLGNAFSTSSTYAVGDCCIYNKKAYKCKTAITTAGAWDSTKWDEIVVLDAVVKKSDMVSITNDEIDAMFS